MMEAVHATEEWQRADLIRCHFFPILYLPRVWIVAILAAHRAALKKYDKPYARTVHRAKCF